MAPLLEGAEERRLVSRVPAVRMHDDELDVDAGLAGRLLALQFPAWADLPLVPVGRLHWAGTDLARVNNAYMDGAIESGERAAAEIIGRDG